MADVEVPTGSGYTVIPSSRPSGGLLAEQGATVRRMLGGGNMLTVSGYHGSGQAYTGNITYAGENGTWRTYATQPGTWFRHNPGTDSFVPLGAGHLPPQSVISAVNQAHTDLGIPVRLRAPMYAPR